MILRNKKNNNRVQTLNVQKIPMIAKSLAVGLAVGVVVSLFRLVIVFAEDTAFSMYEFVSERPALIAPLFILLALVGYGIGWLLKKQPLSGSSGIPQVKGQISGHFQTNWWQTLITKFFGSTVTMMGGLAMGREGPAVQLGGCVGQGIGERFATSPAERKALIASGAGAGLGAVLSAPLAGVMFAIEEIFKYFSPLILLCTMTAALAAQFVTSSIFGLEPIFHFELVQDLTLAEHWILIPMGILIGLCGVGYNFFSLEIRKVYRHFLKIPTVYRPIIPFVLAGILGLILPDVLCSGEVIIDKLELSLSIEYLLLLLVVKFVFFQICFGSGAPGGNLFPIFVLGSMIGAVCGYLAVNYLGFAPELYPNFVILGMAAYFTAIARTPITAVILLLEVTGSFQPLLSLAVVSLIAYVVADLLKSQPIYEALLEAMLADKKSKEKGTTAERRDPVCEAMLEQIVHYGSFADGKKVKALVLPKDCLIISIKRGAHTLIPNGETRILPEDYLVFITYNCDEAAAYEELLKLTSND